jgi:protein-L-isoaspartate(D-aspartate) O-methyltransferase
VVDDLRAEREALVDRLTDRRDLSPATEQAMRAVPRHAFVSSDRQAAAYDDSPLPIGEGQTISAPHMVAVMTDLLDADEGSRVLEVGTGCGYHAAVTAELVGADPVYSVEYHDSLAREARKTLGKTGYEAVSVRAGDGREGWSAHAPYDRAYLTCAAPTIPTAVVEQVRPGGLVLAPVGQQTQTLVRARKRADSTVDRERHGGVRFVPLQ